MKFRLLEQWYARSPAAERQIGFESSGLEVLYLVSLSDNTLLSCCGFDLQRWSLNISKYTGGHELLQEYVGHRDVTEAAVQVTESTFVSCSFDGTLKVWEIESGQCLNTLELPDLPSITSIVKWNDFVITTDRTPQLCVWDSKTWQCLRTYEPSLLESYWMRSLAVLEKGWVVVGNSRGEMVVFDIRNVATAELKPLTITYCGAGNIWDLVGDIDKKNNDLIALASSSYDEAHSGVIISNLITEQWILCFNDSDRRVRKMVMFRDEIHLCCSSLDGTVNIWELTSDHFLTGECVQTIRTKEQVWSVVEVKDGTIAVGLRDGRIQIYKDDRTLVDLCCRSVARVRTKDEIASILPLELYEACLQYYNN